MRILFILLTIFNSFGAQAAAPGGFNPDLNDGKAQDIKPHDVIHWEGLDAVVNGNELTVGARMTADAGWSIYKDNLTFEGPTGFTLAKIEAPTAKIVTDPMSGKDVAVYEGGEFFLTFAGPVDAQMTSFTFGAKYVGCTKVICLFPYTEKIVAPLAPKKIVADGPVVSAGPATPQADDDFETAVAGKLKSGSLSYGMVLLLVFLGGIFSNLTPCVYPMIPITLRLLSRQGHSPRSSAAVYAAGIVITYTALGLVAALSGGMFGSLLASKAFNLSFAVIMMALGVTMLGFGDFSKLQMLGNKLGAGKPSLRNTFLMGTGAGLVAAPCTGPILAALLAFTANSKQGVAASTLLLFTYSLGFGLPYVFLGGAAAKVSQIKVGPQVQIGVKLLFASVMFGLGLYYLRIPLYGVLAQLKPFWPQVSPIALGLGLVLAVVWVVVPALQNNKAGMILPTALLGVGLFSLSQQLTSSSAAGGADAHASMAWHHTEADAFQAAQASGKPILIDMWAEWCEACKKMDKTTFSDSTVIETLSRDWVLLKMDLTESTEANDKIQEKYALQGLPTLVLLPHSADLAKRRSLTSYVSVASLLSNLQEFKAQAAE